MVGVGGAWGFIFSTAYAPNAVPALLGIPRGTPAAAAATLNWTGILTSLLLVGWAVGGIIFGRVADRIGRIKTLMLTMALYSLGHGRLRLRAEHLGAHGVPRRGGAGHRR